MKGMEHVAVRAHPGFFQQLNSNLFLSLRKDGATVICSCIDRYHTIQLGRRKRKRRAVEHASDAEVEV